MSDVDPKRVVFGIVVVLAVLLMLDFVDRQLSGNIALGYVQIGIGHALAYAVGGFVAQRSFTLPSILCASAMWVWVVYLVIDIAKPFDQSSVEIIEGNLPTLPILILAAALGSTIGMWSYRQWVTRRAADT